MGTRDGGRAGENADAENPNTEDDRDEEDSLFDLAALEQELIRHGHITGSWPLRHAHNDTGT